MKISETELKRCKAVLKGIFNRRVQTLAETYVWFRAPETEWKKIRAAVEKKGFHQDRSHGGNYELFIQDDVAIELSYDDDDPRSRMFVIAGPSRTRKVHHASR